MAILCTKYSGALYCWYVVSDEKTLLTDKHSIAVVGDKCVVGHILCHLP